MISTTSHGQAAGSCAPGEANHELDANNVRARLYNNGALFWKGGGAFYEVPKGTGLNAIFASGIWIGGLTNDTLRFAGSTYGPWEYWPGPLDAVGNPPADCSVYDRMFRVSATDIADFLAGGTPTPDMEDWPYDIGAPVLDGDGVADNYNLSGGDVPEIKGDQMVWWVMNDAGNVKTGSFSKPIGLEIQVSAYGFDQSGPLGYTTFYDYKIINKGSGDLVNAYIGFWQDTDLGYALDDFAGSDSVLDLGFVFNGGFEDTGIGGYGQNPPAIGVTLLASPSANADSLDNDNDGQIDEGDEVVGLSSVLTYENSNTNQGNPVGNSMEPYYYLQGRWRDGAPMTKGGLGFGGVETTRFRYSGEAEKQAFWSEENIDMLGTSNDPSDRRFLLGSGPFLLSSGDTTKYSVAIVWSRSVNRLASLTLLKQDVQEVRAFASGDEYTRPPDRPIPSAARLLSPPDGSTSVIGTPEFSWENLGDDVTYTFELSTDSTFVETEYQFLTHDHTYTMVDLTEKNTFYWRVKGDADLTEGVWSEIFSFSNSEIAPVQAGFESFLTVENAAGPIDPPASGALQFAGFPVTENPGSDQQVGPGTWAMHTWDTAVFSDYEIFLERSIRNGWGNVIPFDFEVRFSQRCYDPWKEAMDNSDPFATPVDGCFAYDRFQVFGDDRLQLVPFELWNIGNGTPDDDSDDFRMIPAILDADADGWDLQYRDHTASSSDNDPQTDPIYWHLPCNDGCINDDMSPGEAGYQRWLAGSDQREHGSEVIARLVFINYNGGSISTSSDKADYLANVVNQYVPESGTVFRIISRKIESATLYADVSPVNASGSPSSMATGRIQIEIPASGPAHVSGSFESFESDIVSAALYAGHVGDTARVKIKDLNVNTDLDLRGGSFNPALNVVEESDIPANRSMFVVIGSSAWPEGEVSGQFLSDGNLSPHMATLVSPSPDSTVHIDGDGSDSFVVKWTSGGDPNGHAINFIWEVAADNQFVDIIKRHHTGPSQQYVSTLGEMRDFLIENGIGVSESITLYHRVVATDGGLANTSVSQELRLQLGTVTATESSDIPLEFAIRGNYPNPFSGESTIIIDMPVSSDVYIEVFDILGRRVIRTTSKLEAGSGRRVPVSGRTLASGLYVYRVRMLNKTSDKTLTDRFVVVK